MLDFDFRLVLLEYLLGRDKVVARIHIFIELEIEHFTDVEFVLKGGASLDRGH